jgi:hypothetical protein
VGDAVAPAGLQTAVGSFREAEGAGEEEGGLSSIAGVELEVVDPVDRHSVHVGHRRGLRRELLCGHPPPSSSAELMFLVPMRQFNACSLQFSTF